MGALNHMRPKQRKAPDRLGTKPKGGRRLGSGRKPGIRNYNSKSLSLSTMRKVLLAGKRAKKLYGHAVEDELFSLIYCKELKFIACKLGALRLYYDILRRESGESGSVNMERIGNLEPIVSLPELKVI